MSSLKSFLFLCAVLLLTSFSTYSQITVYTIQNFNFGTFYQGSSGGTINVSTTGTRTATGDIILMNTWNSAAQAILEIQAPAGSVISITNGADAVLTGSNGGTVSLHLESSNLGSPFTTTAVPPARTTLNIAGKLTIGNSATSPPGTYQGTFSITFNQE
ncbi:DUF4402 domain-containing protein [Pedobacter sp. L105]|uniref:DUF4402 domain-containing protein n=1 Tax=Pedobacter sp. L105 TaxID=1641871 RepID=UPI00131E40AD|nr:DUF4402 domain-containing protein [Pedobacter sp. L105]